MGAEKILLLTDNATKCLDHPNSPLASCVLHICPEITGYIKWKLREEICLADYLAGMAYYLGLMDNAWHNSPYTSHLPQAYIDELFSGDIEPTHPSSGSSMRKTAIDFVNSLDCKTLNAKHDRMPYTHGVPLQICKVVRSALLAAVNVCLEAPGLPCYFLVALWGSKKGFRQVLLRDQSEVHV